MLCPLFFFVYVNDLPQELKSDVKHFADNTLLFSDVNCVSTCPLTFNNGLMVMQGWANKCNKSYSLKIPNRSLIHHSSVITCR